MFDRDKPTAILSDRLILIRLIDASKNALGPSLKTKQTPRLIYHVPPDKQPLTWTASHFASIHAASWGGQFSMILYCGWPKYPLMPPIKFFLLVYQLLAQITCTNREKPPDHNDIQLRLTAREAIAARACDHAFLLPLRDLHLCNAATAVHWLESPPGILRTVWTTVTNLTKNYFFRLRAVRTTADTRPPNATYLRVVSTERAFTEHVLPASNPLKPSITLALNANPPPLPPITTPPDDDYCVFFENLRAKILSMPPSTVLLHVTIPPRLYLPLIIS